MTRGIEAYLPSWLRERPLPAPPAARKVTGAFLFSDISGFTALTEKLQARGRAGAEEIAELVSSAFRPAIRAVLSEGGAVLAFGGDALLSGFRDPGGVLGAERAAASIARAFARRGTMESSAGPATLGVRQAIHHGTATELHLGTRERRHYLVAGRPLVTLARLEATSRDPIALSDAAARARSGARPRRAAPPARDSLDPYLPPGFEALLRGFGGSYRRAAILFLETQGADRRYLQRTFRTLAEVLPRYGGMLLKTDLSTSGTKWLCVFGIPVTHEDLGERAARAALDILDLGKGGLRGGLHEGIVANVIVGTPTRRSFDVIGDVVNTAARALATAAWGEVVVTQGVRKHLTGVETETRGAHAVKGKKAKLELHALTRVSTAQVSIRVSAPMVGRDAELATIVAALERAKAGQGSVIAVEGNPGLGKSRLKYEAAIRAREMGVSVHEGRAISFGAMSYWVIGDLLRQILGAPVGTSKQELLAAVTGAAERLSLKDVDRHHLAEVLGARYEGTPIEHLKPRDIRLNNMIAIRAFCQGLARADGPRLLVLEDLHWADEASREAITWVTKALGDVPLVALLLHRPGYAAPAGATRIGLGELGPECVGMLLRAVLGEVPARVEDLVAEKAAGNPFYVEELVRHLLESGLLARGDEGYVLVREPGEDDLPDRIETLIAARLDGLTAEVRKVAELGAVIGRSFLFDLLVHLESEAGVRDAVTDLEGRELIQERTRVPHRELAWKHALTRDVAYAGILLSRRRKLHAAVADAIEAVLEAERESFLALLGHHRQQAGDFCRARSCYLAAARTAASAHSLQEAERLYRSYLDLADETDASIDARNELGRNVFQRCGRFSDAEREHRAALTRSLALRDRLRQARSIELLGIVYHETSRRAEAHRAYAEAVDIYDELGLSKATAIVLGNLASLLFQEGRTDESVGLYERVITLARRAGDRHTEGLNLGNLANVHAQRGDRGLAERLYRKGLRRLEQAKAHLDVNHLRANWAVFRHHAGNEVAAAREYRRVLFEARELGDRSTVGVVSGNLGILHFHRGEHELAEALTTEALVIARETGSVRFESMALTNLGAIRLSLGQLPDAVILLKDASNLARKAGDARAEGACLGLLGRAQLIEGDRQGADESLTRAHELARRSNASMELVKIRCVQAQVRLDASDSVSEGRKRIRIPEGIEDAKRGDMGRFLRNLERARGRRTAGRPLVCGHAPEDITPGQMKWLRKHRPHAIPPEVMTRLDENGVLRPERPQGPGRSPRP